jgi:hypothetical protein
MRFTMSERFRKIVGSMLLALAVIAGGLSTPKSAHACPS